MGVLKEYKGELPNTLSITFGSPIIKCKTKGRYCAYCVDTPLGQECSYPKQCRKRYGTPARYRDKKTGSLP